MNFTLLGKLRFAIQNKIRTAKEAHQEYNFVDIKRSVLDVYKNQIGPDRELYNKSICSHFGKLGAEAMKLKRKEIKKVIAVLKEVLRQKMIKEAEEFWLQEKIRSGGAELSPEGDITFLEEESED